MFDETDGGTIVRRLFGAFLMAVGALLSILSGLCSAVFGSSVLFQGNTTDMFANLQPLLGMAAMVFVIGGIPFAAGLGLIFLGYRLYRGRKVT